MKYGVRSKTKTPTKASKSKGMPKARPGQGKSCPKKSASKQY